MDIDEAQHILERRCDSCSEVNWKCTCVFTSFDLARMNDTCISLVSVPYSESAAFVIYKNGKQIQ